MILVLHAKQGALRTQALISKSRCCDLAQSHEVPALHKVNLIAPSPLRQNCPKIAISMINPARKTVKVN